MYYQAANQRTRLLWRGSILLRLKNCIAWAKAHYQFIIALGIVLLSVLIVYGNDFQILANEVLQNETFSHILLIPFFVGFLFYKKKDALIASHELDRYRYHETPKYVDVVLGAVLCLLALLVYWYGSYTFYPIEYHLISLPFFVMGITLILLNSQALKILIFPIMFLLFLIPPPTTILYTAGGALANFNTQVSYFALKPMGIPVTLSSSYGAPTLLLSTSAGQPVTFAVDIACSGVYSLIAFVMFAVFLAFIASTSLVKKLLLFILGFFVFSMLNIIRIISIVSVAYAFGEQAALFLHSVAGLILIFAGMLLVLVISERVLKIQISPKPQQQEPCSKCKKNKLMLTNFCEYCGRLTLKSKFSISKATQAKLLLLLLGCSIAIVSIRAPTFATAQGTMDLSPNNSPQNATNVFPEISNYTLTFLYRDTEYEKIADQDASLLYGYFPENTSAEVIYVDIGVANSISNLHNWEVCLITMQTAQGRYPLVSVQDSREIQLLQDPPLTAQYLVFDSPSNYTQVTLYWYERASFKTGLTVEQKYVRISLIILTRNSAGVPEFEQSLLALGQLVAGAWEPMKTEALVSLGVPALQSLLLLSVAFLIATEAGRYLNKQKKAANNMKIFNAYATAKEKLVLQNIVDLTARKDAVNTKEVIQEIQKQKRVSSKEILGILNTLERHGIIKRTIVSKGNTVLLLWKV